MRGGSGKRNEECSELVEEATNAELQQFLLRFVWFGRRASGAYSDILLLLGATRATGPIEFVGAIRAVAEVIIPERAK